MVFCRNKSSLNSASTVNWQQTGPEQSSVLYGRLGTKRVELYGSNWSRFSRSFSIFNGSMASGGETLGSSLEPIFGIVAL